jgi:hypothetical protein
MKNENLKQAKRMDSKRAIEADFRADFFFFFVVVLLVNKRFKGCTEKWKQTDLHEIVAMDMWLA